MSTNQFKAHMTLVKGHWQQKIAAHQLTLKDAYKPRFSNDLTIFIPKLTPDFTKPCVFFDVRNRYSKCYIRCSNPLELAETLEQIALTLRSNTWLDKWQRINDVSDRLIVDNLYLDEDYLDMTLFNSDFH